MMNSLTSKFIKTALLSILLAFLFTLEGLTQETKGEYSDLERTFMPAVQMGYVAHGTEELAGGLMIQTSVEYRDISNFILRINFDDFNSNINVPYPINDNASYTGRTSFSELIGGIGYRQELGKHNITTYVQPGFRFYGFPVFEVDGNQVNLDFDSRRIGMIRYSVGYEYLIAPKLFLTIEALASHVLKSEDFWEDNRWSYGITMGISAPIY